MEYRRLGRSGLFVSSLTLGTMTFGGQGGFGKVGSTDVAGARRQVDMCLDAGVNLFDTADIYSGATRRRYSGRRSRGAETSCSSRRRSACP
jgi:aryl-alcohol dehydrogenase-like predicted oxidoreductase